MLEPRIHDPHLMQAIDTVRRHELSEAIQGERLTRQAESGELNPVCRFLVRVGDLMVAVGKRLQARYAPASPSSAEVCYADC